jgi:hypothetical protein
VEEAGAALATATAERTAADQATAAARVQTRQTSEAVKRAQMEESDAKRAVSAVLLCQRDGCRPWIGLVMQCMVYIILRATR